MSATVIEVHGHCAPAFSAVRAAFAENLAARDEVGAAVCLRLGGEVVIDLWGGWRDGARTRPWTRDTRVNVWSSTKGVNAACFAMLVQRGLAGYDDPVARWWPAFAAEGKSKVTLGDLLSHQAGLCGFSSPATVDDLYAGEAAAERLAAQAPIWPLGTGSGYHAISIGILSAALFRRIEGRTIRQFVADEIAGPHGLDLSIGLDPSLDDLAAEIVAPPAMASSSIGAMTAAQVAALANPPLDPRLPNTAAWRAAELPSANGFAHARSLAGVYGLLLAPDAPLVGPEVLTQATAPRTAGVDLVLNLFARWGAGFLVNDDGLYGPGPRTFGHSGWGGSFAFADPDRGLAMSYVMNRMGEQLRGDPRGAALIAAAYAAVG
ncbi:serine hydrolase domain-containing protein [Caulobacter sp. KR2-114]|uniref:serine hydrolase domain-containing protein n=1 Tax=Caulobacter sp. KR2-114 TaxID=3400912 RepID=UPI003C01EC91